jgi:DNA-binding winged helix-turn-helix (wHTH) protein/TolB-like protein/tetratricopeptide (TPR) repeat protein
MDKAESVAAIDLAREPPFSLGALQVRPATREVVCGERREVLEPRVMQVLVALASRRGEVVSRDELIVACWGGRVVGDDAINRAIAGVRRVASDIGGFSLETVARVGYRLNETALTRPTPRRLWRWAAAIGAALLLALGCGLWLARDRILPSPAPSRVAVLPFDVIGGGAGAEAFSVGLLDTLVGSLSADQVETVSRTESRALHGPDAKAEIARLGAGLLLDGDVASDGKTLKVRVHLDDAASHTTLWSRAFEGPAQQPEALQTQIAAHATPIAKLAISPTLKGVWRDRPIVAAFLEATDEQRNEDGGRSLEIARDIVARAPRFAAGHMLLASALIGFLRPTWDSANDAQTAQMAEAASEARTAIRLDPRNGDAYGVLAATRPLWRWSEREQLLGKGFAVDPDNPELAQGYGLFLLWNVGRTREAADQFRRAARAEPYNVAARETLAVILVGAGQPKQARATIADAWRLWPDFWELPLSDFGISASTGDYGRALALLDNPTVVKGVASPPLGKSSALDVYRTALLALQSGTPDRKAAAARVMEQAADDGTVAHREAMQWLPSLGDVDGAFRQADLAFTPEILSRAAGLWFGNTMGVGSLYKPGAAAMRRDPRFMVLAARLGLVDYWRSTGNWPDFCAEPGLPYNCKAEAARLASGRS